MVAVSPTNQLYVGGTFKTIKNGAVLNSIATYDPKTGNWVSMDGGVGFYPKVFAIDFTPDGDVIIGGQFQIAGEFILSLQSTVIRNARKFLRKSEIFCMETLKFFFSTKFFERKMKIFKQIYEWKTE